jgi:hypothetical protein
MPNNESDVTFREIDMGAEARKAWGEKWSQPEVAYEFSNGRKFTMKTGDAAIYVTSPDFE